MDFFQSIHDWFTQDVYQFVTDTIEYLAVKLIWMRIKFTIWLYGFSWSVASALLADLRLAATLNSAISAISPTLQAQMEFFNVFSGIQLMLQSVAAKFSLNFVTRK